MARLGSRVQRNKEREGEEGWMADAIFCFRELRTELGGGGVVNKSGLGWGSDVCVPVV